MRELTRADILAAHWFEHLHGHGAKGMYLYGYTCKEHPRLTCHVRREARRAPETKTFFVDGKEMADIDAAALALIGPHELDGIAQRLTDRLFNKTVEFVNGRLIVTGETASRVEKLRNTLRRSRASRSNGGRQHEPRSASARRLMRRDPASFAAEIDAADTAAVAEAEQADRLALDFVRALARADARRDHDAAQPSRGRSPI